MTGWNDPLFNHRLNYTYNLDLFVRENMKNLLILMLLISFGSCGAVFFTPGLPEIATYFQISNQSAELTVTWYLIGYAFGQLLYGPMAHSLGSNRTIRLGSLLTLVATIICILSGLTHSFTGLIIGRCLMALGAGSGLKMTLTLSTHLYTPQAAARAMSIIIMAFAITPGLGVFIGGLLVHSYGWISSFYLMIAYSLVILGCSFILPEMYAPNQRHKFNLANLVINYSRQFKNLSILSGGFLLGMCSSIVYVFAALVPFIGMQMLKLTPAIYGSYNLIPIIGSISGSRVANYCGKFWQPRQSLKFGIGLVAAGVVILGLALLIWNNPSALFIPMIVIYLGTAFIFGNATSLSLANTQDKSNGSAVVSFLNMSSSCLLVLVLGQVQIHYALILPIIYGVLILLGVIWYQVLVRSIRTI